MLEYEIQMPAKTLTGHADGIPSHYPRDGGHGEVWRVRLLSAC